MGVDFEILLNGSPVDLTDATILMQVKRNPSYSTAQLEYSTDLGNIVITEAVNGLVSLPANIVDIVPRVYVYDLQITLSTGRVITPFSGTFTVNSDVSRA